MLSYKFPKLVIFP